MQSERDFVPLVRDDDGRKPRATRLKRRYAAPGYCYIVRCQLDRHGRHGSLDVEAARYDATQFRIVPKCRAEEDRHVGGATLQELYYPYGHSVGVGPSQAYDPSSAFISLPPKPDNSGIEHQVFQSGQHAPSFRLLPLNHGEGCNVKVVQRSSLTIIVERNGSNVERLQTRGVPLVGVQPVVDPRRYTKLRNNGPLP